MLYPGALMFVYDFSVSWGCHGMPEDDTALPEDGTALPMLQELLRLHQL